MIPQNIFNSFNNLKNLSTQIRSNLPAQSLLSTYGHTTSTNYNLLQNLPQQSPTQTPVNTSTNGLNLTNLLNNNTQSVFNTSTTTTTNTNNNIHAKEASSDFNSSILLMDNMCQWPDCRKKHVQFDSFEKFAQFHLMQEHLLDEKSHAQVIKQMSHVQSIENELEKQKNILNGMLVHLNNQMVRTS